MNTLQIFKNKGGGLMYKYCVANLHVNCLGESDVSFYAYSEGPYGLHRVNDWNDKNVLWYDTEEEAKKQIYNSCECVVSKLFEDG